MALMLIVELCVIFPLMCVAIVPFVISIVIMLVVIKVILPVSISVPVVLLIMPLVGEPEIKLTSLSVAVGPTSSASVAVGVAISVGPTRSAVAASLGVPAVVFVSSPAAVSQGMLTPYVAQAELPQAQAAVSVSLVPKLE